MRKERKNEEMLEKENREREKGPIRAKERCKGKSTEMEMKNEMKGKHRGKRRQDRRWTGRGEKETKGKGSVRECVHV